MQAALQQSTRCWPYFTALWRSVGH